MTASVRGAGKDRFGAADTTMLIWKVIHANPGIARDDIFAKVEDRVPEGWATRRYVRSRAGQRSDTLAPRFLFKARRFVVLQTLVKMREWGSVAKDEAGGYRTLREIKRYSGDPSMVDETGTLAAEHLNAAYALPLAVAAVDRVDPSNPRPNAREWQAIVRVVRNARRIREWIAEEVPVVPGS